MLSFRSFVFTGFIALSLLAGTSNAAFADEQAAKPEAAAPAASEADSKKQAAARAAFEKLIVHGPDKVKLGNQATLSLPAGVNFIPKKQALAVMAHMGNHMDEENFYGLLIPADENQKWFVAASFDDSGFIKDDDQASIDADKILEEMQKGLKEDNDDRKAQGISQLEIVGWIEKPHYDAKAHQLIWSIEAKETGGKAPPPSDNAVNYNTFALGRGGFISLNLVTSTTDVGNDKKIIATLLQNLAFDEGRKYENFDPKTDKVAEYGLMALIGGVAAKKLGLFALLAAVVAKSAKALIVVALAAGVAVKKFFKRRDPTV
ncbi:MAG: DUF2167 domain-containing protein [Alphaproteobacteria bacterium]|nr:MAG: DUF2167 domain-containing protein [Alphaproteobacteria bacterium]